MSKIVFIHYRTGERDGVSMEIEKRAHILKLLGHRVYFISGYDPRAGKNNGNIFIIPQLDIKKRLSSILRETFFFQKILDGTLAWLIFHSEEEKIYHQLLKILKFIKPDLIFVHNIFSTAYHLPATTALLKVFDRHPLPIVSIHHDFWWERNMFHRTRYDFINEILEHMPPKREYILKQQVINSIARKNLSKRLSISAEQIGDYFDFSLKLPGRDNFNSDLLERYGIGENDLVILHATRIVERKAIENAILLVSFLQKTMQKRNSIQFKNKLISKKSKIFLLLPNFIEADEELYFKRLKNLADELRVNFLWIGDRVLLERKKENGLKIYSFWDVYAYADFVTFTSFAEGFGNQLLEAFWLKKIPVIFEYPVFKNDIKKEGYRFISLGDKMRKSNGFFIISQNKVKAAVEELFEVLKDEKKYQEIVGHNFRVAKTKHDVQFLEKNLKELISTISPGKV